MNLITGTIFSFRIARTAFSQPQQLYIPLLATCLVNFVMFGYFIVPTTNLQVVQNTWWNSLTIIFVFTVIWTVI